MTTFAYTARTLDGKQVAGVMQADSEAAVARTLDEQAMFPVRIAEHNELRTAGHRKIKLREVGVVYSQLSELLNAGVPLVRALTILSNVGLSDRMGRVVVQVRESVSAGETLGDAMGKHPAVFTTLHIAMVRAGERAGFLEQALGNLAGYIERQDELTGKVRGAMLYPLILTLVGVVAVVGILVVLVPRFKPFFRKITLPPPTAFLFGLSDLLVHHLPLMIGVGVLGVIGVRALVRSETGRVLWDRWRLRIPVLGRVLRLVGITRFCRVLGTMLANGVPILQALAISKDAVGSRVMAEGIEQAAENVRGGEPLAEPLRKDGLFPVEIVEMIAVGEESNQLETVLVRVADTVERRTNRQVDAAVRLMEPLILVVLAVVIGFVAVGLLYPMMMMSEALT